MISSAQPSSSSSPPSDEEPDIDYVQELQELVDRLLEDPDKEAVASEIQVLQSIYGEDAIRVYRPTSSNGKNLQAGTIRYQLKLPLPDHESTSVKLLVSLPPSYPSTSPPQLQLLSKYIGAFSVDPSLFGSVLRTYISTVSGVEFVEDQVCVFDGVQNVLERCEKWYGEQLSLKEGRRLEREEEKERGEARRPAPAAQKKAAETHEEEDEINEFGEDEASMPEGVQFYVAEPIQDRKSVFIGRACRISQPSQVPQIIAHLMTDRRIARAAHPVIHAWRCQVGSVLHQDNDDDGETAAGGRLAHLLQILEVPNVLVVVTRYFGGIHLGPDRFKHINQAARAALEVGGFLDGPADASGGAKDGTGGKGRNVGRKKH
ncbi:UPF0029-domain-containing protein [Coprinopsis sp. MPI-PUGE-AT-0042]|nr:UPF0029-domain-containing protein [Coprinopsis sp. MPI-PUGE-AT-0042]